MTKLNNAISENNLSVAWAKAFLNTMSSPNGTTSHLIVHINGFRNGIVQEDAGIRDELSKALALEKEKTVETVAGTIFPYSLWNKKAGRNLLFDRYLKTWPIIKQCPPNRNGTYFQRIIAFNIAYENKDKPVNQLKHVIETWLRGNHRHSALQIAIFDPRKDHNNCKQAGFPCLHQLDFCPLGANGNNGLTITAFYPTQHIFNKAYGNYLGLSRLGEFAAKEMRLELKEIVCISSVARIGKGNKKNLEKLAKNLESLLEGVG